jgi:hypothetical protein
MPQPTRFVHRPTPVGHARRSGACVGRRVGGSRRRRVGRPAATGRPRGNKPPGPLRSCGHASEYHDWAAGGSAGGAAAGGGASAGSSATAGGGSAATGCGSGVTGVSLMVVSQGKGPGDILSMPPKTARHERDCKETRRTAGPCSATAIKSGRVYDSSLAVREVRGFA